MLFWFLLTLARNMNKERETAGSPSASLRVGMTTRKAKAKTLSYSLLPNLVLLESLP